MDDNLCKHWMVPEWCAECKGLKTAEEEAEQEEKAFKENIRRWGKIYGTNDGTSPS